MAMLLSSNGAPPTPASYAATVETAILQTLAYVDVFDYPLTAAEIHRYLSAVAAPAGLVEELLVAGRLVPARVVASDGYYALAGREGIIDTRRRRAAIARRLWPVALAYGTLLAGLPFVRMVAITGSLAVDNVEENADVDYLIVTANDRLWLCRAFAILAVRLAARRGVSLCPNYLLSERALVFRERNLYTAHELAQMIPISGAPVYRQIRTLNAWTDAWLPNANDPPQLSTEAPGEVGSRLGRTGYVAEWLLGTSLGTALEQWERKRKIARFSRQQRGEGASAAEKAEAEAQFSADWCKGHFEGHASRILDAYQERLRALQVEA